MPHNSTFTYSCLEQSYIRVYVSLYSTYMTVGDMQLTLRLHRLLRAKWRSLQTRRRQTQANLSAASASASLHNTQHAELTETEKERESQKDGARERELGRDSECRSKRDRDKERVRGREAGSERVIYDATEAAPSRSSNSTVSHILCLKCLK